MPALEPHFPPTVDPSGWSPPLPEAAGFRHLVVETPGLRTHVAVIGEGEPVVLLHGFPQHWWQWRCFSSLFYRHNIPFFLLHWDCTRGQQYWQFLCSGYYFQYFFGDGGLPRTIEPQRERLHQIRRIIRRVIHRRHPRAQLRRSGFQKNSIDLGFQKAGNERFETYSGRPR